MTILTINKKRFEKDIGKLNDKMQEDIALFGTPIERISESELDIELFPNRPDLLSYENYKHSFLSYLGKGTGLRKIEIKPSGYKMVVEKSLPKEWPYAFSCIVRGLKFDGNNIREIIDLQEKLGLTLLRKRKKGGIGLYPLQKIEFPVTFKGVDPNQIKFRPLEFPSEITGKQVLSKHPTGRKYAHLVDGWGKFPVFVDAKGAIMSMPPIINSHDVGKIDETTKEVFIECTGTDSNVLKKVMNIIVASLERMGGKVYSIECVQQNGKKELIPDLASDKIKISLERVNKFLGLDLKDKEIKKFLERLGHDYNNGVVSVSPFRVDVLHEVDLIEDIAIAYGYDKFVPEIPKISTIGKINPRETLKRKIAEIFSGLGMLETISYHLVSKDTIKRFEENPKEYVKVENSKTEHEFLRKDLASYLMKIYSENVDVEYPHEIFQIGRIFDGFHEKEHLAVAMTPGNFTKLKQALDYFSRMLDVRLEVKESNEIPEYFIEGRVAKILFNNKFVGFLGEVHPKVIQNFKLKMPVALFEIDLDEILNQSS